MDKCPYRLRAYKPDPQIATSKQDGEPPASLGGTVLDFDCEEDAGHSGVHKYPLAYYIMCVIGEFTYHG